MDSHLLHQQRDTTIYQYKLIRKVTHRSAAFFALPVLLAGAFVFNALQGNPLQMVMLVLWIPIWLVIHRFLISLLQRIRQDPGASRWGWRKGWPWFGFLPNYHYGLRTFLMYYWNLLFVGIAAACLIAPWGDWLWAANALFIHLWLVVPRIATALRLKRGSKDYGMIRITDQDIGYYLP
ncbi:hypothetical protein [Paenibacillus turpanensis]|uniref:hypothetical protein n=1 Tax=Paenibacillus turpanensis TaxID=2689078 RepID=UPI00140C7D24|nr:hypothetical protein [Paenibacillus turpanensis]